MFQEVLRSDEHPLKYKKKPLVGENIIVTSVKKKKQQTNTIFSLFVDIFSFIPETVMTVSR